MFLGEDYGHQIQSFREKGSGARNGRGRRVDIRSVLDTQNSKVQIVGNVLCESLGIVDVYAGRTNDNVEIVNHWTLDIATDEWCLYI